MIKAMSVNAATGLGFSVIIAAYNEELVIAETIHRTLAVWPECRVIVVDDGSSDATSAKAAGLGDARVLVHRYQINHGKGYAIGRGIDLAETPYSLQLDADCQFPPESMPELVAPMVEGRAKVVFCSRYCLGAAREEGSITLSKYLASLLASGLVSVLIGQRLTDVFAGFKAWDTDFAQKLGLCEAGFGYEAEIAIKTAQRGERIPEVAIAYASRKAGESKIRFSRDLITVPLSILQVWLLAKWKR
jgi:glycosyltransferase involved in cell wall biosynthesis